MFALVLYRNLAEWNGSSIIVLSFTRWGALERMVWGRVWVRHFDFIFYFDDDHFTQSWTIDKIRSAYDLTYVNNTCFLSTILLWKYRNLGCKEPTRGTDLHSLHWCERFDASARLSLNNQSRNLSLFTDSRLGPESAAIFTILMAQVCLALSSRQSLISFPTFLPEMTTVSPNS